MIEEGEKGKELYPEIDKVYLNEKPNLFPDLVIRLGFCLQEKDSTKHSGPNSRADKLD